MVLMDYGKGNPYEYPQTGEKNHFKTNPAEKWDFFREEERKDIYKWADKRVAGRNFRKKTIATFLVYSFDKELLLSFMQNINFMVIVQMTLAVIATYIFQTYKIQFDVHVGLFVSPIVFPLAFSINTDFQRREKVLEDLAVFKSSSMLWYFCMREWRKAAQLGDDWIEQVYKKLKSLLFHLREYLLTYKTKRRKAILRAMYEDFSDANQLIEHVRASALPANTAIVSRSVHLLNMMCLSFERLRVVREYRSPRSIRSFNKVFIMFLPIILSPYFVYLGEKCQQPWQPYYIAVLVAFVFSALQGVQDKLDDPFDGFSEDDINLDTIDEWTFGSLDKCISRTFDVKRFKVTVHPSVASVPVSSAPQSPISQQPSLKRKISCNKPFQRTNTRDSAHCVTDDHAEVMKIAHLLEGVKGDTRITRKSLYRKSSELHDDNDDDYRLSGDGSSLKTLETIMEPSTISITDLRAFKAQTDRKVTFLTEPDDYPHDLSSDDLNDPLAPLIPLSSSPPSEQAPSETSQLLQSGEFIHPSPVKTVDNLTSSPFFDLPSPPPPTTTKPDDIDMIKLEISNGALRAESSPTPSLKRFKVKPLTTCKPLETVPLTSTGEGMKHNTTNSQLDPSYIAHVKASTTKPKFVVVPLDPNTAPLGPNIGPVGPNLDSNIGPNKEHIVLVDPHIGEHIPTISIADDVNRSHSIDAPHSNRTFDIPYSTSDSVLLLDPDPQCVVDVEKASSSSELHTPSVVFKGSNYGNSSPINNTAPLKHSHGRVTNNIDKTNDNTNNINGNTNNINGSMNTYMPVGNNVNRSNSDDLDHDKHEDQSELLDKKISSSF